MPNSSSTEKLRELTIDRSAPARSGAPRWTLALGALALLAVGVAAAWSRFTAGVFETEVKYTAVTRISPAQGAVQLTSTGYVVPESESKVGPRIQGRVKEVFVVEGQQVKQGDLLVVLDDAQQRTALATAKARVLSARARVTGARAAMNEVRVQHARQEKLLAGGAVATAVVEDLAARLASLADAVSVAESELKAAEADASALEVNLEYTRVYAPIDGTVITKPVQAGETVGLSIDNPSVLEIADLSTLVVETDVPEDRLDRARPGGPAEITLDAFPGKRFRGEVKEIRPRVNRAKATVPVKVRFVDPVEGVLPEMSAQVSFLDRVLDEASLKEQTKVVVPATAVAERGGAKVVFVVDDKVARMRAVSLGESIGSSIEIKSGPEPGTKLVDAPPSTLMDGHRIAEKIE